MHFETSSYSPVPLTDGCARHITWTGRNPIGTTSSSTPKSELRRLSNDDGHS